MLKQFFFCIWIVFLFQFSFAQGLSLNLDAPVKWVNAGNINVTGSALTLEAMVRITSPNDGNIISKHTTNANTNYRLRAQSFEITTSNGHAVLANPFILQTNVTYHLAATYNGSMMRFYVNGCLTAEQPWTGTLISNSFSTAIGQQSNCQCEQFIGLLDEVRIWNVARTEAQIRGNIYNIANPNFQFNLLAYFKFQNNFNNLAVFSPASSAIGSPALSALPYPYPSALAISHTGSNVICNNSETGAIDLQASGGLQPYQFSIDGVNYQSSPTFSDLSPGSYTIYVQSNNNCLATASRTIQNKTPINLNLNSEDVSCHGDLDGFASVNPSGGNGAAFTTSWSNGTSGNSVGNLSPGNYSVTIKDSCRVAGNELVINGHFEQGPMGFSSQYNACPTCYVGIGEELFENQFVVGVSANQHHVAFNGSGQGGGGNFMMINGSSQANTNVWCQTIDVQPNTYYEFSAWVTSIFAQSPAQLQFQANGVLLGPVFTAPNAVNTWNQFFSVWFSGNNASVTICIINQNTSVAGNDFGIDNISFKACLSCEVEQEFTINEPPVLTASASSQAAICGTNTGSITISAEGGAPNYSYSLNGLDFSSNATLENLAPGQYNVMVKDAADCEFSLNIVVEDVNEVSVDAGPEQTICAGEEITLAATGPNGFIWLNGNPNAVPFTPTETAYYVVEINLGPSCYAIDSVLITVHPLPTVNTGNNMTICDGESITLNATGAATYVWSNGEENGSSLNLSSGTYDFSVVGTDANGCSNQALLNIQVFSNPIVNLTANPTSGIVPLTVEFTNNFDPSFDYFWNFGSGENELINTNSTSFTFNNVGDFWVTVSSNQNGCFGNDSILIQVFEPIFDFVVPNVFSPNGDDDNPNFILTQMMGVESLFSFEIVILNRWGNIVHQFDNPSFIWNGEDQLGNALAEGVYFYKIKYATLNGEKSQRHGFVHLVR